MRLEGKSPMSLDEVRPSREDGRMPSSHAHPSSAVSPSPGCAARVAGLRAALLLSVGAMLVPSDAVAQTPACTFRGAPEVLAERESPLDSVRFQLGGEWAKLCYGRPSARGRIMVGGEDPFGSPWRLGANEPTTLHLPFPATIGTVDVQPGSYTLYAIPSEGSWTIVVNTNTSRWGIPLSPGVRQSDIGSFKVPTTRLGEHVETLTFRFEGGGSSGALVYAWEHTTFTIPIARK